jgi:hypothetical protein
VFGKSDDLTFLPTSQELSALVASVDKNIETVLKVRQFSTFLDGFHYKLCVSNQQSLVN